MSADGKNKIARRDFMRTVGLGVGAGASAAALAPAMAVAKPETADERKKSRYRETDHVKTYYRLNRF